MGEQLRELDVEQIKTVAELDDYSEHGGLFDVGAWASGLLPSPFERTSRTMLPKVDSHPEPVVGVEAGKELLFTQEHSISHTAITAVESNDSALVVQKVHAGQVTHID
jgi:hypothetical protein